MGSSMRCADSPHDWAVGVVVPARDEEESIEACLESIMTALDHCDLLRTAAWVTVVTDSCRDATAELARGVLRSRGSVIESCVFSAGAARRFGATEVLKHLAETSPSQTWIANTDADSRVAADWISRQLELAYRGYCAVAGIVHVADVEGVSHEKLCELLADYTINEDGSHSHVHGANLGVRADAYIDAGGWLPIALAEDHCLWSRVKARGWPTVACSKAIVHTSGRLYGRAAGGFADTLRKRLALLETVAAA